MMGHDEEIYTSTSQEVEKYFVDIPRELVE